jgi:hypothetical protein
MTLKTGFKRSTGSYTSYNVRVYVNDSDLTTGGQDSTGVYGVYKVGGIYSCQKTGSIDRMSILFGNGSGTMMPEYRFSLQTVDINMGGYLQPSGTLFQEDACVYHTPSSWTAERYRPHEFSLTTPVSVTTGDLIAIVVEDYLETGDAWNNMNFGYASGGPRNGFPCGCRFQSSWQAQLHNPNACLMYDDDEVVEGGCAMGWCTGELIETSTTVDEIGTKWTQPCNAVFEGLSFYAAFRNVESTFEVNLYDENDVILSTYIGDAATHYRPNSSSEEKITLPMHQAKLRADTDYRIAIKPTSTTSGIGIQFECGRIDGDSDYIGIDYVNATWRENSLGIGYSTYRADAGAWTDDTARAWRIFPFYRIYGRRITSGGGKKKK